MVTTRLSVFSLCLFAYIVQWAACWCQPRPDYYMMTDSSFYWENVISLVESGSIKHLIFPMGFSILLVPFYLLGFTPYEVVLWIHPLVHALTVFLAYVIVRHCSSSIPALFAGFLIACYPPAINYARQLLTEPWFAATIMGGMYCLIVNPKKGAFLAGLLLGFAVLIRTPALGIVIIIAVLIIVCRKNKSDLIGYILGSSLVIGIGILLASYSAGHFLFLMTGTSMTTSVRSILSGYEWISTGEQQLSYFSYLYGQPLDFFKERLFAFINIVFPWPFGDDRSIGTKLIILASDLPVLIGVLLGTIKLSLAKYKSEAWFLLGPAVGLILFYGMLFAISRYRMPYYPPLICFLAIAFSNEISRFLMKLKGAFSVGKKDSSFPG